MAAPSAEAADPPQLRDLVVAQDPLLTFSPDATQLEAAVYRSRDNVDIKPMVDDPAITVRVNDQAPAANGYVRLPVTVAENDFQITATKDGQTTTYDLTVTKVDTDFRGRKPVENIAVTSNKDSAEGAHVTNILDQAAAGPFDLTRSSFTSSRSFVPHELLSTAPRTHEAQPGSTVPHQQDEVRLRVPSASRPLGTTPDQAIREVYRGARAPRDTDWVTIAMHVKDAGFSSLTSSCPALRAGAGSVQATHRWKARFYWRLARRKGLRSALGTRNLIRCAKDAIGGFRLRDRETGSTSVGETGSTSVTGSSRRRAGDPAAAAAPSSRSSGPRG